MKPFKTVELLCQTALLMLGWIIIANEYSNFILISGIGFIWLYMTMKGINEIES